MEVFNIWGDNLNFDIKYSFLARLMNWNSAFEKYYSTFIKIFMSRSFTQVFDAPSLGAKPFEVRVDAIKEFFSKNKWVIWLFHVRLHLTLKVARHIICDNAVLHSVCLLCYSHKICHSVKKDKKWKISNFRCLIVHLFNIDNVNNVSIKHHHNTITLYHFLYTKVIKMKKIHVLRLCVFFKFKNNWITQAYT